MARAAGSQAELEMLDAPVSGGVAGAEAGTLTFMVGGGDKAFARAKPVLEAMGKIIIQAGAAGSGQAAKVCNNMILGISMIAVCEAFVLAEKLGPAAAQAVRDRLTAPGQCWSADELLSGARPGADVFAKPTAIIGRASRPADA